ncbi:phosphotransferase family protein [Breoghania sp.]|uniref:phosphotransferase family protein n=1 Tax=Breoghania sp. TaxID=2065378 RepID=UPI002AAB0E0A|nr:phosphotransferase family protein [Breoghania sp.]
MTMAHAGSPELEAPRAAHRFDEARVRDWLGEALGTDPGPLYVQQFEGGMSNPTFLLTTSAGKRYVLRKKPPGELLPRAHAVDREYRIINALQETPVPVPGTVAFCDDISVIGVDFFLMDFVEGRVIADPAMGPVPLAERRPLAFALVDTLAELHKVDYEAVGLGDFGRPEGFMARQVKRWKGQYETARSALPASLDHSDMDWLAAWLAEQDCIADEATIVHGDFRLGNVIIDRHEPRPLAVLDWELSTIGHPLSDLAYLMLPYHLPHMQDPSTNGAPTHDDMLARYVASSGRSGLEHWPVFLAFACFRYAAIVHGVAARAAKGNVSSARADPIRDAQRAMTVARIGRDIALDAEGDTRSS